MKKCKECGEIKDSSEFYKHKDNKDGLRGKCKSCWCKATSRYQSENLDKYADYSNKYYHSDKGQIYIKEYYKTDQYKKTHKNKKDKYIKYKPQQYKAQQFLHDNIRYKGLFKPTICTLCGVKKDISKIHGHHWSYLKEHWLDVVWCCSQCHSDIHNNKESDILDRQNKPN